MKQDNEMLTGITHANIEKITHELSGTGKAVFKKLLTMLR